MSNGPLPTRLVLLSDLPSLQQGEKVRFLGCVQKYKFSAGTLHLQHAYPPAQNTLITAVVDVDLLLSTLQRTDTQVGEWQNVVGYVQAEEDDGKWHRTDTSRNIGLEEKIVKIQAVMLWSAGALKIGEYERALEMRKQTGV